MSKKNKFYWFEGVTRNEVEKSLSSEGFAWLRKQSSRRTLVLFQIALIAFIGSASYWKPIELAFGDDSNIFYIGLGLIFILACFGIFLVYTYLRTSVRHIADAPDELLDERQIRIRNSHYRTAYIYSVVPSLLLIGLLILGPELSIFGSNASVNDASWLIISYFMTVASIPSMVVAWSERNI